MITAIDARNQTIENIEAMIENECFYILETLEAVIKNGDSNFIINCPKGMKDKIKTYFNHYGYQVHDYKNSYLGISW